MQRTQPTNNPNAVLKTPLRGGVVVEKRRGNRISPMKSQKPSSLYGTSMGVSIRRYFSQLPLIIDTYEYFKTQLYMDCTELSRLSWLCGGCVVFNATFVL